MSDLRPKVEWWTASEIADAALPDMPASRQGVEQVIKRDSWRAKGPELCVDTITCSKSGRGWMRVGYDVSVNKLRVFGSWLRGICVPLQKLHKTAKGVKISDLWRGRGFWAVSIKNRLIA